MDDKTWNEINFGIENYKNLITNKNVRKLDAREDDSFISELKKLLIKNTSKIDGNKNSLKEIITIEIKGKSKNCDKYFNKIFQYINIKPTDIIWVGWHDQIESIEISGKELLEEIVPILFVGHGTFFMDTKKEWLIEYKFDEFLSTGKFII